jgi:hypothetical protein
MVARPRCQGQGPETVNGPAAVLSEVSEQNGRAAVAAAQDVQPDWGGVHECQDCHTADHLDALADVTCAFLLPMWMMSGVLPLLSSQGGSSADCRQAGCDHARDALSSARN